jgi:FAD/FMN-containing dehydrogenase
VPEGILICYGHAGDGNLHCNVTARADADHTSFIRREEEVRRVVHDLVCEFRGSISAEHGIGRAKLAELPRYISPIKLALMRQLKAELDPQGIMNPGVLF